MYYFNDLIEMLFSVKNFFVFPQIGAEANKTTGLKSVFIIVEACSKILLPSFMMIRDLRSTTIAMFFLSSISDIRELKPKTLGSNGFNINR